MEVKDDANPKGKRHRVTPTVERAKFPQSPKPEATQPVQRRGAERELVNPLLCAKDFSG